MNEPSPPVLPQPFFTIYRRHLPVLVCMVVFATVCVGVTGIFAGSTLTARNWEAEKLKYEQRLGTQSAEYAKNLSTFQQDLEPTIKGLAQTQKDVSQTRDDVQALATKFDRANVKRDRQSAAALAAATESSHKSDQLAEQLAQQQRTLVPKLDEAVSASKAVERKLPNATQPSLPPRPWVGGR